MSIFNFIDNVDWNKNIIFLLLYVSIVALCVFLYLFPIMDSYKSAIMEYRKTNILDTQIHTTLTHLQQTQDDFLQDNISIFQKLKKEPNISEIRQYVASHIKDSEIADLGVVNGENHIKIQTLKINGKTNNIEHIKNLIANISTLENSIRIAFPIIIKKDKNMLFTEISMMIYNSTKETQKQEKQEPQEQE